MKNLKQKHYQSGAILITALVMLVLLTMLGLSTMNTSTLEEKMAANSQEINRAFQTAETGLEIAMTDADAFTTANTVDDNGTVDDYTDDIYSYENTNSSLSSYGASVTYRAEYRQKVSPPRGSGWDKSIYSYFYFDLSGEASTPSGAAATVHGGAYQIGPSGT
jgi:type IV pilus assembly protein PilX